MATAELTETKSETTPMLKDETFQFTIRELCNVGNLVNTLYLLRAYVFLAVTIGATIWFYQWQAAAGISFWWNVPVTILAILCVGAGQHQLAALAHEATHHTLLRHRLLNDLVSDWFCMFPLFGSTHHYRLQHMAHHQFVNDPVRDPDVSQLQTSGHWLQFPINKPDFIVTLLKQLWLPNLFRYIRIRAKYNSVGSDKNPYLRAGWKPSKVPVRVGILYIVGLMFTLTGLVRYGDPMLLGIIPALGWITVVTFYAMIPAALYHQSRVHPVISSRAMTIMRMTYITILFSALAWITLLTGEWAALYFTLLWLVPMFTSFSFYMILRQLVQHGNGDRGRLTNTRVFLVNPLIQFAVFPLGQEYHLPHHMFATIPHYRLKELHELLLNYDEYRTEATVVEGYFVPPHRPPRNPTVLDVLGPDFHAEQGGDVYIDNSVLELDDIDDKEDIIREGHEEIHRLRGEHVTEA